MSQSGQRNPIARQLADFAATLRFEDIPPTVVKAAKDHLLDALGVGLAATALEQPPPILKAVGVLGHGAESTGLGLVERLPAPAAALLNGTLIHSLEFDDTHIASVVHGSAVLVPTALALSERDDLPGAELLRALVLGWEAFIRLGLAAPGEMQPHGFQVTAVGGPFAAALTAAALMELDAAGTTAALGIAGSQSAGLFEFLTNGSTAKHIHGGWPAHAGIVAAALARAGMSGPDTIFEGRFGFYRAYARSPAGAERLRQLMETLGAAWHLPEAAFKMFPCCHYVLPFLECLEDVLAQGCPAEGIAEIRCEVPAEEAPLICEPWGAKLQPANAYQAKWSLPYCLAARLIDGKLDVATFDRTAPDARLLPAAQKVRWAAIAGTGFPKHYSGRIEIVAGDGRRWRAAVEDVRGGPARPFSDDDLCGKFAATAGRRLSADGVARVLAEVASLDLAPSVKPLGEALRLLR